MVVMMLESRVVRCVHCDEDVASFLPCYGCYDAGESGGEMRAQ
jgi:hypothetical protein